MRFSLSLLLLANDTTRSHRQQFLHCAHNYLALVDIQVIKTVNLIRSTIGAAVLRQLDERVTHTLRFYRIMSTSCSLLLILTVLICHFVVRILVLICNLEPSPKPFTAFPTIIRKVLTA